MVSDRKAQGFTIGSLANLAVILITVGLIFGYGLQMMNEQQDDLNDTSSGYNFSSGISYSNWSEDALAVNNASEAMVKLSDKLPTIAGIIGVVVLIFYVGMHRQQV